MTTRALVAGVTAVALSGAAVAAATGGGEARSALARAGQAFLAALEADVRADATWPFADEEREDIHFAPFPLDGVEHGDLDESASLLAEELLAVSLSQRGHANARAIRDLERDVKEIESERFWSFALRGFRDPGRYLIAIFGEPASDSPWAFRYEGHHLSINVTSVPGQPLATTPLFLGAQPRLVPEGLPSAGVATLGEEERLARALYASLQGALRERATLPYEDDRDLMLGQVRRVAALPGTGLPREELNAEQRALLDALVERFVGVFEPGAAAAQQARIEAAGRDRIRFAHVESDEPPNAFYTRIEGPTLLIEIDNTSDGDHVHAVWHDLENDFGDDVLAAHYRQAHVERLAARSDARR